MFGRYVAGLSFAGNTLRTAVRQLKKAGPVLCHLSEERTEDLAGAWFLRGVVEPRTRLLRKVSAVSVGVDNSSVFYHSFPADQSLTRDERDGMIDWELSHFIADYAAPDFVRDVHVLVPESGTAVPAILVVAANRSFVQGITSQVRARRGLSPGRSAGRGPGACRTGVDLSVRQREYGGQAYAHRLLGQIASRGDPPDLAGPEAHYRQAMALARERGMRPLVAHCHLGLGRLSHRTGDRPKAQEYLATAATMYREMGMTLWLGQAQAEIRVLV